MSHIIYEPVRQRLQRSELAVPGSSPKMFEKALNSPADYVFLDLEDASQKKIYDWARRHHNGTIILKNATTGQVRGIRYNRTGGGQWGKITRLKEQVLETNQKFTVQ